MLIILNKTFSDKQFYIGNREWGHSPLLVSPNILALVSFIHMANNVDPDQHALSGIL